MVVLKLGKSKQPANRKSAPPKKKQYTPLYNTPKCTYTGKKRGRKSREEKEKSNVEYTKKTGLFVLDFD